MRKGTCIFADCAFDINCFYGALQAIVEVVYLLYDWLLRMVNMLLTAAARRFQNLGLLSCLVQTVQHAGKAVAVGEGVKPT